MAIPALQNVSDGFAIDLYNSSNTTDGNATTQSLCVDNLLITQLQQSAGPLEATSSITLVANQYNAANFGFLEGPMWRETEQVLLFTDISNDRMYSLDPSNDSISIFRNEAAAGSENYANGLANDVKGDLLIAEQSSQSIVRRFDDRSGILAQIALVNQPNGVTLSPDQSRLYVTESGTSMV